MRGKPKVCVWTMPAISRLQINKECNGRLNSTIIQTKDINFKRENN
jgi:hypothetical protein